MNRDTAWLAVVVFTVTIVGLVAFTQPAQAQGASRGGGDDIETHVNIVPNFAQPATVPGATVKACVGSGFNNENDWIEYSWNATPLTHSSGPTLFENAIRQAMDDEDCVPLIGPTDASISEDLANGTKDWSVLSDCYCLNITGRWSVYYQTASGSRPLVFENFTVTDPANVRSTIDVDTLGTIDTRTSEIVLIGLAVLAFWQGWIFAGAGAWLAAIGSQFTDPGMLTYTFGFAWFSMFLGLELVANKFGPLRRIRTFLDSRDGD